MKKALRLIFLLLIVFCLILPACAETGEEDRDDYDADCDEGYDEYDEYYKSYAEAFNTFCRLEDDKLIILEGIETLGSYEGDDPGVQALFENNPGSYLQFSSSSVDFSTVDWPSSIRRLGACSFEYYYFDTLTLPASLEEMYRPAVYDCIIETLRIECTLPVEQLQNALVECWICAYEVPEDHPLYKSVDGVLYSKDGKTLLAYPNAREDSHFDVPAGVECIGRAAFNNPNLKTVSLPIGLKTLEDYAFASCTRLQSIALPLTVTRIGEHLLDECISLELVSLPEGMEVKKPVDMAYYYEDDSLFRGDNGDTRTNGDIPSWTRRSSVNYFAWLKEENDIPVYDSMTSTIASEPVSTISGGIPVYVDDADSYASHIIKYLTGDEIGWVDNEMLETVINDTLFDMHIRMTDALIAAYGFKPEEKEWGRPEGPWFRFFDPETHIPLTAVELYRDPLPEYGSDELGIVTDGNSLIRLPLLDAPDGTALTELRVGTQIRILEEKDSWVRVSTGYETGWLKKEAVRIIPVISETEEE